MPDFRIQEWNEANLVMPRCGFVDWCLEGHKWAFLSDFARASILQQHGGIYLDADVLARRPLHHFLSHRAFSGFESAGYPFTAVWGCQPDHPWPHAAIRHLMAVDPKGPETVTNTQWMSELLARQFDINRHFDAFQVGREGVAIYPSTTFCLDTPASWCVHQFAGSWLPEGVRTYQEQLHTLFEAKLVMEQLEPDLLKQLALVVRWRAVHSAELSSALAPLLREQTLENAEVGQAAAFRTVLSIGRRIARLYLGILRRKAAR